MLLNNLENNSKPQKFCRYMLVKGKQYKLSDIFTNGITVIGLVKQTNIPRYVYQTLYKYTVLCLLNTINQCKDFFRLKVKNIVFQSELYDRNKKHNTMYVKCERKNGEIILGKLKCFIKHTPRCRL